MTFSPRVVTLLAAAHLGFAGVGPALGQTPGEGMASFDLQSLETPAGAVAYRLYRPDQWSEPRRLLVMLHGCTQDAADLAAGTAMNGLADEGGFAVLYPEQDPARHPQRCWFWYEPGPRQAEMARVISLLEAVTAAEEIAAGEVYLVGLSAGGALAQALAVTHPKRFAALAVHSGVAFGAAESLAEGVAAMQRGAPPERLDPAGLPPVRSSAVPARVLVIHGADDAVVRPVNGEQVARQWVEILGARMDEGVEQEPSVDMRAEGGRTIQVARWQGAGGEDRVMLMRVEGLGHAWSGGDPAGTYTDPAGPSASRHIVSYFRLHR